MISRHLYRLLQCPTCRSRDLVASDAGVYCASCKNDYPAQHGYLDLMPRAVEFGYTSKYVSEEAELAAELDYREMAPALLAAGVRDRALARLLKFQKTDVALDNGCGTAKHAIWNRDKVGLMIGNDPATMFADEALATITLTKADSRRLPFADNTIDKSFSIDVLEHFPLDVIDAYLAETARVLRPGGRFLAFSNTKEPSTLQPLVDWSRWIGRQFVRAGVYDFEREARRKSDHIKAMATWEDVLAAMDRAELRLVKVVFWNSVFTSFVEHVVMKLGDAAVGRRDKAELSFQPSTLSPQPSMGRHKAELSFQPSALSPQPSNGTAREIRARQTMRGYLKRRGPVYYALFAVTLLMELDLWLFGRLRSGSYFIVVEKV
ncbi:MAG: class I SAM-dependent methyltransferase [Roseiflexaceae bacterium]|nr:class I SAM-dependent methyltransferase [Roseiflexaceae bacterium]